MRLTDNEVEMMVETLQFKKDVLLQEIEKIDQLIAKVNNNDDVVEVNDVTTGAILKRRTRKADTKDYYYNMVKTVLRDGEKFLSSREILQEIYTEYSGEIDEGEDRKHIAGVSSVLYAKALSGEVEQQKNGREPAKFRLTIDSAKQKLKEFDNELLLKQGREFLESDKLPF